MEALCQNRTQSYVFSEACFVLHGNNSTTGNLFEVLVILLGECSDTHPLHEKGAIVSFVSTMQKQLVCTAACSKNNS